MTRLPTPLRASRVLEQLGASRFAQDLRVLGVVESTSDLLMRLAEDGAKDGTVIVAEMQTRGRGRRGSLWVSPNHGGLWFSVLLRREVEGGTPPLFSATVGLALAKALESEGLVANVKWPNDVLIDRSKVAGSLIDLGGVAPQTWAVLGIGINVDVDALNLPNPSALPAGSLSKLRARDVDREELLAVVLRELEAHLELLHQGDQEVLIARYATRDALRGTRVVAEEGKRRLSGRVLAVHPLEGLVLLDDEGREHRLRAEHTHVLEVTFPS